jgi:hypothetical protein
MIQGPRMVVSGGSRFLAVGVASDQTAGRDRCGAKHQFQTIRSDYRNGDRS